MPKTPFDKIIFFSPTLSQPRIIRRVEMLASAGYDVAVYGYRRTLHNGNYLKDNIPVTDLGAMSDGKRYLSKIAKVRKGLIRINKEHKGENALHYSFGYIQTLLLFLSGKPYVYEISDIVYGWPSMKRVNSLLKRMERMLVKHSVFTVMTSEGFKKYLGIDSGCTVVPNKVNPALASCERKVLKLEGEGMRFSFIGTMLYRELLRFAEVIGKHFPQHEFHFYGSTSVTDIMNGYLRLTRQYPNVVYHGEFRSPDDLASIYGETDIVVSTYGTFSSNATVLEPNKLYEGMFFCRPIIVTAGTHLASAVEKYGCGISIDSGSGESIRQAIDGISPEAMELISQREKEIDPLSLCDSITDLDDRLSPVVKKHRTH